MPVSLDPSKILDNDEEESEDGEVRTRTNTLLQEGITETTSIFSSKDKRTNVLETDDTKDMIITVEHASLISEENGNLTFPLQTTPEIERKSSGETIQPSSLDKTDNTDQDESPSG